VKRVPESDLQIDDNDVTYYEGVPFTGISFDLGPNGELLSEGEIRDGVETGRVRVWFRSGKLMIDRYVKDGLNHGPNREWFESGQLAEESEWECGCCLRRKRWDANGGLVEDYQMQPTDPEYATLELMRRWHAKFARKSDNASDSTPTEASPSSSESVSENCAPTESSRRPACPVCGGVLVEIKQKLVCSRCHTICETCCEGGRG
jgi:hypothetical protein